MSSVVCTLFESHYHYGVAALTNSLYHQGYRGAIYAGYRGTLPFWAAAAREEPALSWPGGRSFEVAEGLILYFLPLQTDYHLTNYKPDFMLQLWESISKEAQSMFYFDPDIVVTYQWLLFEEWVQCGIALCEDIHSPLARYNPRRVAWRQFFGSKGLELNFKDALYANGGFVGLSIENISFLSVWKNLQEMMATQIGGLSRSALTGKSLPEAATGYHAPFAKTDQDALNAAIEAWAGNVSFVGKEGMAFDNSMSALMPHALGQPKPWQWDPLRKAISGYPPRLVDIAYWHYAKKGPIAAQAMHDIYYKQIALKLGALIGRFYRKRGTS